MYKGVFKPAGTIASVQSLFGFNVTLSLESDPISPVLAEKGKKGECME